MKSKLAAGINVYNDTPGLKRCVDSLREGVDLIIVVDGKYDSWGKPDDNPFSTDGFEYFLDECEKDKINLVTVFAGNEPQHKKRTAYLEQAGKYNCTHLLVIDADEYVQEHNANWPLFRDQLDNHPRFEQGLQGNTMYSHNISYQAQPNNHLSLARLIYKPGELEYRSHWLLFRKSDGSPTAYQIVGSTDTVKGITIATDDLTRPIERLQQDISYQWLLFLKEGEITEEQYKDPVARKIFADHIIYEMEIWKQAKEKQND